MRKFVTGGLMAAAVAWTGAAQAQLGPAPWAPAELYVGLGGQYGMGNTYNAFANDSGSSFSFSATDIAGAAPFLYGGVRAPFRGMFFGVEGEYDFVGRSHGRVIDVPGSTRTVFAGPLTSQTVTFSNVGASTENYALKLSDRVGLFGTASIPVAGIEVFGKVGATYRSLEQSYTMSFNGPVSVVGARFTCGSGGCVTTSGPTTVTRDTISVSGTQHLFAPAVGGGLQIPFGNFFVRIEGQVDLLSFNGTPLTYTIIEHQPTNGAFSPGGTVVSTGQLSGGFGAQNLDARLMVSVGAKW